MSQPTISAPQKLLALGGGLKEIARIEGARSALLIVDLQYLDAHPDFGIGPLLQQSLKDGGEYYFGRLQDTVIPNVVSLRSAFRQAGAMIVHTRIRNTLPDGSDGMWRYREFGTMIVPPDSKESEFMEPVAPQPGEVVIDKTSSSPFNSTGINQLLVNRGVRTLAIAGVVTASCIETTARDAGDRGYQAIVVGDACAGLTAEEDSDTMRRMHRTYAVVMTSSAVVDALHRPHP